MAEKLNITLLVIKEKSFTYASSGIVKEVVLQHERRYFAIKKIISWTNIIYLQLLVLV